MQSAEDLSLRLEVIRAYQRDKPKPGREMSDWFEGMAAYYAVPERRLRTIIADECAAALRQVRQEVQSTAQAVGDLVNATTQRAMATLAEGMDATIRKPIVVGSNVLKDDDGNITYAETPDWKSRLKAAELTLEARGDMAPKKIEHTTRHINTDSDGVLIERLAELHERIGKFLPAAGRGVAGAVIDVTRSSEPAA